MARGNNYVLTNKMDAEVGLAAGRFKGQVTLIMGRLVQAPETGLSVQEIADAIKDKLQTKQDPVRVVGFYISTWKKSGVVKAITGVDRPVVEGKSETEEQDTFVEQIENAPAPTTEQLEAVNEIIPDAPAPSHDELTTMVADIKKSGTLKDAVFAVVNGMSNPNADEIVRALQAYWKPDTTKRQVNDALLKLAKKDEIRRFEGGGFFVPGR